MLFFPTKNFSECNIPIDVLRGDLISLTSYPESNPFRASFIDNDLPDGTDLNSEGNCLSSPEKPKKSFVELASAEILNFLRLLLVVYPVPKFILVMLLPPLEVTMLNVAPAKSP